MNLWNKWCCKVWVTQLASLPTLYTKCVCKHRIFVNYSISKNSNVYYSKFKPSSKMLFVTSLVNGLSGHFSASCLPVCNKLGWLTANNRNFTSMNKHLSLKKAYLLLTTKWHCVHYAMKVGVACMTSSLCDKLTMRVVREWKS